MLKWLRGNTSSKSSAASPELDFRDPDAEKFAASLNVWRKSLEARRSQDTKLDQNDLTFMAPEALAELKDVETARRKATAAKKRAATLKAKAKQVTIGEKPAAKKPAVTKKPAAKPTANKSPAKKPTAKLTVATATKKPAAVKAPAKKPAATKAAVKKPATKAASKKAAAKPVAKKVTPAPKKPIAKPKPGTKTNKI
jgi:hypothetical protein|tara:strand:+ start:131 stop:721 length:591 start_codon:yes stop_codon:yes gene_type:complete